MIAFNCCRRLFLDLFDGGFGSVPPDGVDAVEAALHSLISLGHGDDLTVPCLETETDFACLIGIDLELGVLQDLIALDGLILDTGDKGVPHNAGDTLAAGSLRLINLGSGNDLAIGGFKIELDAGLGVLDYKLTHKTFLLFIGSFIIYNISFPFSILKMPFF